MKKGFGCLVANTLLLLIMGGVALAVAKAYEIFQFPKPLMIFLILVSEIFAGWILVLIYRSEPFQGFMKWVERD